MDITVKSMLLLSVLTTILMIVISVIVSFTENEKKYSAPLEFWISYGAYFFLAFILEGRPVKIIVVACVAWIWRVRAIRLILENITGEKLLSQWHTYFLIGSYLLAKRAGDIKLEDYQDFKGNSHSEEPSTQTVIKQ